LDPLTAAGYNECSPQEDGAGRTPAGTKGFFMPSDRAPKSSDVTTTVPRPLDAMAAFLSYLIPGLGQIYQGRVGKGLLFFVCIYVLFFYGMYLGSGSVTVDGKTYTVASNVYLPDTADQNNPLSLPRLPANLYNRPQFLGQFWIGIAAWPALVQYATFDKNPAEQGHPLLGQFQRTPTQDALNALNTSRDKLLDLGWVFTVIAGVLNIMVIYDALAGPAFLPNPAKEEQPTPKEMAA
jgi:TM2 domain-containing membrane protein YozV